MSGSIIVIGGGVRSGKSGFALRRARGLGPRRGFVATAQALDDEMAARIADHVRARGPDFATIEEPLAVPERLAALDGMDTVVVDCLTLWLSNLLLRNEPAQRIAERVDDLLDALRPRRYHAIVVTNEVGMGVVPDTALGRIFRDIAGYANQRLAASADELYLAAMGVILRLRPGPVAIQHPAESP